MAAMEESVATQGADVGALKEAAEASGAAAEEKGRATDEELRALGAALETEVAKTAKDAAELQAGVAAAKDGLAAESEARASAVAAAAKEAADDCEALKTSLLASAETATAQVGGQKRNASTVPTLGAPLTFPPTPPLFFPRSLQLSLPLIAPSYFLPIKDRRDPLQGGRGAGVR